MLRNKRTHMPQTKSPQYFKVGSPWYLLSVFLIPIILAIIPIASFAYGLYIFTFGSKSKKTKTETPSETYYFLPEKFFRSHVLNVIKKILSVVLFPLYLCRIGLGALIQLAAYPGHDEIFFRNRSINYNAVSITMSDGICLYTVEHTKKNSTLDDSKKNHIIWMGGNGANFDDYNKEIVAYVKALDAKVIGFHHGHYGKSGFKKDNGFYHNRSYTSKSILLEEGKAQVQRLLDKDIPANQITLYGHSMGGGIASLVASHFHHQGIKIKIFNDRSFSSISSVVESWFLPDPKETITSPLTKLSVFFQKAVVSVLIMPIVKALLHLSDWEINAGDAYHSVEEEYKDYAVVRAKVSPEKNKIFSSANNHYPNEGRYYNDEIIPYNASIHLAEKTAKRTGKNCSKYSSNKNAKYAGEFFSKDHAKCKLNHMHESNCMKNRNNKTIMDAVESLVKQTL